MEDQYSAVANAMTPEAREVAITTALAWNPRYQGAKMDDILSLCEDFDQLLWFREPFWKEYGERYDRRMKPYVKAASIAVALVLGSSEEPNPLTAMLVDLLARQAALERRVVAQ